jgi:hypothetical protein
MFTVDITPDPESFVAIVVGKFHSHDQLFSGRLAFTHSKQEKLVKLPDSCEAMAFGDSLIINAGDRPINIYLDPKSRKVMHCDDWSGLKGHGLFKIEENGKSWIGFVISPKEIDSYAQYVSWRKKMRKYEQSLLLMRKMLVGLCH